MTQKELCALPKDSENDFAATALGGLLSRPKLVGDVVSNWLRIANGKRTICFAVNKAHAAALLDSFRRQGVAAELLTDQTEEAEREEEDLSSGRPVGRNHGKIGARLGQAHGGRCQEGFRRVASLKLRAVPSAPRGV